MMKKIFVILMVVVLAIVAVKFVSNKMDQAMEVAVNNITEDLVPIEEVSPKSEDLEEIEELNNGYNVTKVEGPELCLSNQLDRVEDNYYYAEINELFDCDGYSSIYVTTNMPVERIYYTLTDENGEEVYSGGAGLSWGKSLDGYDIGFNKQIFDPNDDMKYDVDPSWKDYTVTYYMQSGKDHSIKITPNYFYQ